jgi:M6 family metalloprotease-like protein
MRLRRNPILWIVLLSLSLGVLSAVPPCPGKRSGSEPVFSHRNERVQTNRSGRPVLPQNILVLRVDFPETSFDMTADYPDYLAHDEAYAARCMFHLHEYLMDNSRGAYDPTFTISPLITVPKAMAYYGDDNESGHSVEFVRDAIETADAVCDFSAYDAVVIFHAGAGQESDLNDNHTDELWSTFVNRYDMQEVFDPENDDYPGIPADGVYITRVCVLPESEWQPDFTTSDTILGVLGVIVHEFGHEIGLPTLYDNVTSDGSYSQGVGNFDPMGTGAWNANGYVPPMMSAWSRVYLGWERPLEVTHDMADIDVQHILFADTTVVHVLKIPISDGEYFLIENRQQNPDNSTTTWYKYGNDGLPVVSKTEASFTFDTLYVDQKHYDAPNQRIPKFDFMTNSYRHCEWDFYLPGYGGPETPRDGSGIYIWHIDENVIAKKFTTDFKKNYINSDPTHKGVDLEEADGVQDMDRLTSSYNIYGCPNDAFRADNKDYFGYIMRPNTGMISLPTAESYYGGIPVEVYDISESGVVMSLSVRFCWSLNTDYPYVNTLPMMRADFDADGHDELLYPMPDGEMYWWRNDVPLGDSLGFPAHTTISGMVNQMPAFDSTDGNLYTPCSNGEHMAGLQVWNYSADLQMFSFAGWSWCGNPLVNPNAGESRRAFLPIRKGNEFQIRDFTSSGTVETILSATGQSFRGNLVHDGQYLYFVTADSSDVRLWTTDVSGDRPEALGVRLLGLTPADTLIAIVAGDINPDHEGTEFAITLSDGRLFLYGTGGDCLSGFPVNAVPGMPSIPGIADCDGNGTLDLLVGGENTWAAIGFNGEKLNYLTSIANDQDSLGIAGGLLALDMDGATGYEIAGAYSRNRMGAWSTRGEMMPDFPESYANRARFMPVPVADSTGSLLYLYVATDFGHVYRIACPEANPDQIANLPWPCELGDLGRTAFYRGPTPVNHYSGSGVFVDGEVYIYPNPWDEANPADLTLNLMVTRNTKMEIKVFDIAGNIIYKNTFQCEAWMKNRSPLGIRIDKLSSGMYFAVLKAGNETKTLRFAVEK